MTIKNIFSAIIICSCYCSISAMLPPPPRRLIQPKHVANVAKNFASTLGTRIVHLEELTELENQTERLEDTNYICPQLFSFKTLEQKEFLIKIVHRRAKQEFMGAKQVRSVFPNADETNITSFSYCELYGNKKLASLGDVVDLPLINFGSRDWLFEVMPKVPGVTLEKLIKGTRIINNEKRLNIFRKIGILLNELNYHKNFCHGCLHLKNIIVDPITENVSLIDWDHCFKKDPSIQDYRTDAELIFWITFSDRILTPIMQSTPSELKTQWGNICNLTSCLRSLLSCSLEKDYGRINICDSECYLDRLQILINHYIKDIDDEDLDQRISMACRFLRPFLPFFTRNFQTPLIANKEEEYYKRVSALFLAIFKESDLTSGEISDMEQKLNLPPKEWHCSFLRRDI